MAGLLAALLTSACVTTMAPGDAGCMAYAEARLAMPRKVPLGGGPWAMWVADTDDRMTATCTGD
jgi:hypothetical protein